MGQIPFSVYDFFGYLCSGCIVLAAGDYALNDASELQGNLGTVEAVVLIILAYVAGHALANLARTILERWVVERGIGRIPTENLMGTEPPGRVRALLFSDYFRPMPKPIQQRVRDRATIVELPEVSVGRKEASREAAKALRVYCQYQAGVGTNLFPALRDFSRNSCLACAIAGGMILMAESPPSRTWGYIAVGAAVALFYRFLRFHRFYEADLLNSFAVSGTDGVVGRSETA